MYSVLSKEQADERRSRLAEIVGRLAACEDVLIQADGVLIMYLLKFIFRPLAISNRELCELRKWGRSIVTSFDLSPQDDDLLRSYLGIPRRK